MATLRSIDDLASLILAEVPRAVGIAGAPGVGKSTLAAALVARIPGAVLLPMDGFHLPQARLVELGVRDRMGAPETFDRDALALTLRDIEISGGTVFAPDFDRSREEPVPDAIAIQPERRPVIVEGNYLLMWDDILPMFDLTVFVELDDAVRLRRLIARHEQFGKSPTEARAWATGPDGANARLIAATADRADHRYRETQN